ncbi:MAG: hypothetical protein OEY07_02945 [Gammaproteobacteria bacterium]|nr:hypothetical protein [Gammaproteobacteria bacterium]
MCFSANASFTAAALLIPGGAYCISLARRDAPQYLPFAVYPLVFGIQQFCEGLLWLSIVGEGGVNKGAAYSFLFFSHVFWLVWVPGSVWYLESHAVKKRLWLLLVILGGIYGSAMYLPMLLHNSVQVLVVKNSIVYHPGNIFGAHIPGEVINLIYALIILLPLLAQSDRMIRNFGILILISLIFSRLVFNYAVTSVWCYFAAVLSLYIVGMLQSVCAGVVRMEDQNPSP